MQSISSNGVPVATATEIASLGNGMAVARMTVSAQFAGLEAQVAFALVQQLGALLALGPSVLALLFETPEWSIDLTVTAEGGDDYRTVTSAGTIGAVTAGMSFEAWQAESGTE
jgi:hypothetical protein